MGAWSRGSRFRPTAIRADLAGPIAAENAVAQKRAAKAAARPAINNASVENGNAIAPRDTRLAAMRARLTGLPLGVVLTVTVIAHNEAGDSAESTPATITLG